MSKCKSLSDIGHLGGTKSHKMAISNSLNLTIKSSWWLTPTKQQPFHKIHNSPEVILYNDDVNFLSASFILKASLDIACLVWLI